MQALFFSTAAPKLLRELWSLRAMLFVRSVSSSEHFGNTVLCARHGDSVAVWSWFRHHILYLNWAALSCRVWPFSHSAITVGEQAVSDSFTGKDVCVFPRAKSAAVFSALCLFSTTIDQRQLDHVCPYERSQALFMFPVLLWRHTSGCLHT